MDAFALLRSVHHQRGALVPGLAGAVFVHMEEQREVREIGRCPDPVELRRHRRDHRLRIGRADRAHAPAAVPRAGPCFRIDLDRLAVHLQRAGPVAVLRHAGEVHHHARPDAAREARLLDREGAAGELHVERESLGLLQRQAHLLQRLDHADRERADKCVHPLHVKRARHEDGGLLAPAQDRDGGIDDIEVRIDAHRGGEEGAAIGAVAVEEEAVIEIAVRAGKGDRFGRLVDRILVSGGEHGGFLPLRDHLAVLSLPIGWRRGI